MGISRMTYALGEIETLCRKAARGAGHSWGVAEEAGRAARWLCAHGFKGAELIHSCLAPGDEALGVGVKLADFPCDQALPRIAAFEALLPFAAIAAQRLGKTCTLSGPMACYALAADGSVWRAPSMGSAPSFQCGAPQQASASFAKAAPPLIPRHSRRCAAWSSAPTRLQPKQVALQVPEPGFLITTKPVKIVQLHRLRQIQSKPPIIFRFDRLQYRTRSYPTTHKAQKKSCGHAPPKAHLCVSW